MERIYALNVKDHRRYKSRTDSGSEAEMVQRAPRRRNEDLAQEETVTLPNPGEEKKKKKGKKEKKRKEKMRKKK